MKPAQHLKQKRAKRIAKLLKSQAAFSLIEMIVVVAVVAVLGTVAVAALVPLTAKSEIIVAKKNALKIVETASSVQALDPDYLAAAATLDDAVAITLGGYTAPAGSALAGFHMGLLTLDNDQKAAAQTYIAFEAGRLVFNGNP